MKNVYYGWKKNTDKNKTTPRTLKWLRGQHSSTPLPKNKQTNKQTHISMLPFFAMYVIRDWGFCVGPL